jgi:hypothetical protein
MSKTRRKIDWSKYEQGLRQRGSITFWFSEDVVDQWHPKTGGTRGGQSHYSDVAIETSLTVRTVFGQALRQTEGLMTSLIKLMDLDIKAPDHTTLSRRGRTIVVTPLPRSGGPLTIAVDSTGLRIYGAGEWSESRHGGGKRRKWMKLHLAVDEATGDIVAETLTTNDVGDPSEVPVLLSQLDTPIDTFLGDGAYDTQGVYDAVAEQSGGTGQVIVPPRKNAVASASNEGEKSQRDRHIITIDRFGRPLWEIQVGYARRLIAENAMGRFKRTIGPQLRGRHVGNQINEAAIGVKVLNRMTRLGTPRQFAIVN